MNTEMNPSFTDRENLLIGINELMTETGVSKMKAITALQGAAARLGTERGEASIELLCEIKADHMETLGFCLASDSEAFIAQVEQNAGA